MQLVCANFSNIREIFDFFNVILRNRFRSIAI